MINIREKFPDVAFQNPAGLCIIFAGPICERAKSVDSSVRSFPDPTGIRISNKCFLKKRIKNPVNGVVEQSVANARFENVPRFGIIDLERLISAVLMRMIEKVTMKRKDIVQQSQRKFLHVFPVLLSALKFFPCLQKIFQRNYILKFL